MVILLHLQFGLHPFQFVLKLLYPETEDSYKALNTCNPTHTHTDRVHTHTEHRSVLVVLDRSEVFDLLVFVLQLGLYALTELPRRLESLCGLELSLAVNFSLFRQQFHLDKDTHTQQQMMMTTLGVKD